MKYVINTDKPKDCKAEILSCIKNQKDKSGSEIKTWELRNDSDDKDNKLLVHTTDAWSDVGCLSLDIDETTCDEAFILFESLFMLEPGYIRFDHDINNVDVVLHPLDHFDVNYSKFVHYKLGLPNRATLEEFLDIINKNTRCRMLS